MLRGLLSKIYRHLRPGRTIDRPTVLDQLIDRGLIVGNNFHMLHGVTIDPDHCWHISIGNSVTLAPRVHILAHDASTKMFLGVTRLGKVSIGDYVFVGAASIILPGITIGSRVIIGAGSVVTRDIPANSLAAGNPARVLGSIDDYLEKRRNELDQVPIFGEEFTLRMNVDEQKKAHMNQEMANRFAYVD